MQLQVIFVLLFLLSLFFIWIIL